MLVIVDYGIGNLGSILNMLKHLNVEAKISSKPEDIERADKLILPGVGAFDPGMTALKDSGLIPLLSKKVLQDKTPVLGVCLGMQMLTKRSEEGELPGLGWIDAETVRFRFGEAEKLKIPHMGWNGAKAAKQSLLFRDMPEDARFYFVHSYHVVCRNPEDVASTTNYGYDFASTIARGNIYGAQFHPEKSHRFGMKLLENFAKG